MAEAPARAALAGNPSDGYGGAVLAVAVPAFTARAEVLDPGGPRAPGVAGTELVDATLARFRREFGARTAGSDIRWSTTIPRSVGLGGSSAIVIATLRALCARHEVELGPERLAELALAVEVEDLGIAAGLQDRVAQAYGGLTFMDFTREPPRYLPLDPAGLPPLLVAWRARSAEPSGTVHGELRRRHEAGEPLIRETMAELAELAQAARGAVSRADHGELRRCADASFDARARMLELDRRHVEMVCLAREAGAAANYAGSGGAIVCLCNDLRHRETVAQVLRAAACETAGVQ
jgi:glucuronokinase